MDRILSWKYYIDDIDGKISKIVVIIINNNRKVFGKDKIFLY